jgi:hypothetical protein
MDSWLSAKNILNKPEGFAGELIQVVAGSDGSIFDRFQVFARGVQLLIDDAQLLF